jgi:hypothetical protein
MKMLQLYRETSGPTETTKPTGVVAEAVVFSNDVSVLHWLTEPNGTEIYLSEEAMRDIRESSGRSYFVEVGAK